MNKKVIGIIGIATSILFFAGFGFIFFYYPNISAEINNIPSIASLNGFVGEEEMDGRAVSVYLNYLGVGILNLLFVYGLFKTSKNDAPLIIGKILLLISGVIWTSFGLLHWDTSDNYSIHHIIIRLMAMLLIVPLGLLMLVADFKKIIDDNFAKFYTLATALIIATLGILSVFVINDLTWIRTNISLSLYFLWFGIIGLRLIRKN